MDANQIYKRLFEKYDLENTDEVNLHRFATDLNFMTKDSDLNQYELKKLSRLIDHGLDYKEIKRIASTLSDGKNSIRNYLAMVLYDITDQKMASPGEMEKMEKRLFPLKPQYGHDDFQRREVEHISEVMARMPEFGVYLELKDIMHETTSDITKTMRQYDN